MSETLNNFLVDLASDPDRLARFIGNPVGELDATALTAEERVAVLGRDSRRLMDVIGGLRAENQGTDDGGKQKDDSDHDEKRRDKKDPWEDGKSGRKDDSKRPPDRTPGPRQSASASKGPARSAKRKIRH
jgi:hypothetical protein